MVPRSSLCSFVKSPVASSYAGSCILLSNLVSDSLIPFWFFNVEDLGRGTQIFQKRSSLLEVLCASECYTEDPPRPPNR